MALGAAGDVLLGAAGLRWAAEFLLGHLDGHLADQRHRRPGLALPGLGLTGRWP